MSDRLYSLTEAVAYIGTKRDKAPSRTWLNKQALDGRVKALRTSAGWVFEEAELDRVVELLNQPAASGAGWWGAEVAERDERGRFLPAENGRR